MARYQPYVEDYDSTVGEPVPLSRKRELKSGLANSSSSTDEGVSDSGYSSQYSFSSTPMTETPPPKTQTPAPPILRPQTANPHRNSSTPFNRPASKSVSRSASPAVPRNIPNSGARDGREGSPNSTGGSSDCDCPNCKTGVKPSPSSPSILSGAWPLHHGSYHAPSQYDHHRQWSGYQYPMRYDGYSQGTPTDSGMTESSRGSDGGSRRERSSMPPPSRSQSTFQGSISSSVHAPPSSSWSQSSGGYFPYQAASPAPQAPNAPPPLPSYSSSASSSMYAPPPLNTAIPAVAARHPLGSPYEYPQSASAYGYPPSDYFGANAVHSTSGSGQSPSDYSAHSPSQSQVNRRNSMRAQASAGAALHEVSGDYSAAPHHTQRRPSNRGERPTWYHGQPQFQDVPNRSYSVPPTDSNAISESRRRLGTPQPVPIRARRDSGSQGSSGLHSSRLGPSSLAHSMESCAIADDPPYRSSSTNHHASPRGHYDVHGALARRDPGTLMQPTHYSSSSRDSGNHGYDKEEFVSLTVPESESDSFTMRYPAGIPVKLQLNGGNAQRISLGHRDKNENVEMNIAYKYVQQRQQQVHAQLQYGAGQLEYGDRRANNGDYHGYHRRESMTGA